MTLSRVREFLDRNPLVILGFLASAVVVGSLVLLERDRA